MSSEVIELPARVEPQNLPVTREALDRLQAQRKLLREFVASQLREGVDYGVIPGTQKSSLYKPGSEKLAQLFGLGVKVVLSDRLIEREGNFAMFTYRAEVYPLRSPDLIIATCEGSCNSQEKKYAARRTKNGVMENTPITDVLNTLIKMAQKRAYVGAVILATGASDFFTQDIDDAQDAATLNVREEPKRVAASIPKPVSASSKQVGSDPVCCGRPMMVSKFPNKITGAIDWYCTTCKTSKPREVEA